jgi:hypothetical protein
MINSRRSVTVSQKNASGCEIGHTKKEISNLEFGGGSRASVPGTSINGGTGFLKISPKLRKKREGGAMEPAQCDDSFTPEHRGTLVISKVRFLREGLAEILERAQGIPITGQSSTLADALSAAAASRPTTVLLDAAFPDSMSVVAELSTVIPESNLIVFAVTEVENDVLPWARAGMVRYVPSTGSVNDVISLIGQISRGEQNCLPHVAESLLRGVATSSTADSVG